MDVCAVKAVVTDIDGVLTDGRVMLLDGAEVNKKVCFKDLDTVSLFRRKGIKFGIITGESDRFTDALNKKLCPDYFYHGCKEKKKAIEDIAYKENIPLSSVCYIGDGKYDIDAIRAAGIGICPADAIEEVKQAADIVLECRGGDGCLPVVYKLIFESQGAGNEMINNLVMSDLLEHKKIINSIINNRDLQDKINAAAEMISRSLKKNGQILLCGNGGSAADAQHIATEFVSRFFHERKALNAEALTVNTSTLTAVGNDYSFDRVFARQVEAKGRRGDVLIGISTSGESKNIMEAFETARMLNISTIAFTGNKDCTMKRMADLTISIPSAETPRIQEMHIMTGHIICEIVEKEFAVKYGQGRQKDV